jgi:hypothetical protein
MMKITITIVSLLPVLLSLSCGEKEQESQSQPQNVRSEHPVPTQQPTMVDPHTATAAADTITGEVQEVLQATSYTYMKIKTDDREMWIAVTRRDAEVGDTVSFAPDLEMKNFESKELQRTFESIYFVSRITGGGPAAAAAHDIPHRMKPILKKQQISVEPAEGGITIGQLLSDTDSYAGKTVRIKGRVTRVNRAIMNRNWVHIQDGTSYSGKFDLTITTQEQVDVGDVVIFQGTINLNRDFGAGYTYEVIMENASLRVE